MAVVFGRRRRRLRRGHEPPARRGPAGEPARHARVGLGGGRAPSPRRAAGLSVTASARAVALEILGRLRAGRVTVADALAAPGAEAPRRAGPRLPPRARPRDAAAPRLARSRAVAPSSSRPLDRLTPGVLDALRLGAYQLLYLRVAEHAAVSESVELARAAEPRSAGFANAVLRRLQREGPPPAPDPIADPLGWLTSAGSLPRWLAERWCAQLGPEGAIARARAFLDAPPTYFRLNPRVDDALTRLAAAGVEARETADPRRARAGRGPARASRRGRAPLRAGRGLADGRAARRPRRASSSTPAPRRGARPCSWPTWAGPARG